MRIVIADDEPPARAVLRDLLTGRDVEICAEVGDGEATVEAIRTLRPDLVFLDVQMPDLDGFEVLARLGLEPPPQVVFVTAYDEFAVRAFEVHALDYLVKPFTDERFEIAFARIRGRTTKTSADAAARMIGAAAQASAPPGHFLVRIGRRSILVGIDEVDWIEADRYYATLHVHGETHLVRESMISLEARLDPASFVRIHRSAIVNLRQVREIRRPVSGPVELVLRDGTSLEVSRSRRRMVASRLSSVSAAPRART
jgi:two-component system, LytTR family, response regulator